MREAYAIAEEANKTLAQAREAVRKVRQARGYFSPESNTGKGMTGNQSRPGGGKAFGVGKGKKGKSSTGSFICGQPGH